MQLFISWSIPGAKNAIIYNAPGTKNTLCMAETSQGSMILFLITKTPPRPMCVWVLCESAPGLPNVSYFTVSGEPGVRQKGKNINCWGSPHPKKSSFAPGMCVFVYVLIAKTTSRCLCAIRVCLYAIHVCVCVCVCVFVAGFYCKLHVLGGMPNKNRTSGLFC